ncbi:MAG TPA: glycosyltransferase family 4 protein [Candidatus Dormibacteraeota bacterium]|nr:glycosyltransferase family 4 protein [Candidatus Dormibacteraeota bacterium]
MSRLRVAWLGQRSSGAGDGLITYSRETTRGLRQRGVDVLFVHHDADSGDPRSVAMAALTVGRDWFKIAVPGSSRRLAELLDRHHVDLVHVSLSFSSLDFSLPSLCHQLRMPVVATFHAPFDTHATMWAGLSRVLYHLYGLPLAHYDRVIVFGASQARLLVQSGVPQRKLRIVPNGVDVERYRPGLSDRARRLGARQLFLYLGRLDREKNPALLIQAFLAEHPPDDVRLALVGGGQERGRLERRYRDPRVVFLGAVHQELERLALLRAADALFLPSSIEGLSLALLEGMACGACPVATDVGCDGDAVRGAGILLDPVHLRSELRLAVRTLANAPELARPLGELARQRAVERFSLERNVDALLSVYGEVLGREVDLAVEAAALARTHGAADREGGGAVE